MDVDTPRCGIHAYVWRVLQRDGTFGSDMYVLVVCAVSIEISLGHGGHGMVCVCVCVRVCAHRPAPAPPLGSCATPATTAACSSSRSAWSGPACIHATARTPASTPASTPTAPPNLNHQLIQTHRTKHTVSTVRVPTRSHHINHTLGISFKRNLYCLSTLCK